MIMVTHIAISIAVVMMTYRLKLFMMLLLTIMTLMLSHIMMKVIVAIRQHGRQIQTMVWYCMAIMATLSKMAIYMSY